jgi:hypothetical protein
MVLILETSKSKPLSQRIIVKENFIEHNLFSMKLNLNQVMNEQDVEGHIASHKCRRILTYRLTAAEWLSAYQPYEQ